MLLPVSLFEGFCPFIDVRLAPPQQAVNQGSQFPGGSEHEPAIAPSARAFKAGISMAPAISSAFRGSFSLSAMACAARLSACATLPHFLKARERDVVTRG